MTELLRTSVLLLRHRTEPLLLVADWFCLCISKVGPRHQTDPQGKLSWAEGGRSQAGTILIRFQFVMGSNLQAVLDSHPQTQQRTSSQLCEGVPDTREASVSNEEQNGKFLLYIKLLNGCIVLIASLNQPVESVTLPSCWHSMVDGVITVGQSACLLMCGCSTNTNEHSMPHHGKTGQREKWLRKQNWNLRRPQKCTSFRSILLSPLFCLPLLLKSSNVTEMFPLPLCSKSRPSAADILWIPFSIID